LGRVLIEMGMLKEPDLVAALARQVGLEYIDLAEYQVDPNAVSLLPEQVARRYRALPIGFENSHIVVAMSDPANVFALDGRHPAGLPWLGSPKKQDVRDALSEGTRSMAGGKTSERVRQTDQTEGSGGS
jgi:hypothetical protein